MHRISPRASMTLILVATVWVGMPAPVGAQSRVYAGGAFTFVTQTHSGPDQPLGGTRSGGSLLLGVQVTPRYSVEFEPSFGGTYSSEYTYYPGPSWTAHVVARRRSTFFTFQLRTRVGVLEPVVGGSYVSTKISRHATTGSRTYFDDEGSADEFALVGGIDIGLRVAPRFYLVPTFRAMLLMGPSGLRHHFDPFKRDTNTGLFVFRYGAGARVTF